MKNYIYFVCVQVCVCVCDAIKYGPSLKINNIMVSIQTR